MAKITLKGNPVTTSGELPKIGTKAPDFRLTKSDLTDVSFKDFSGKRIVLNIFPSIDTPVCSKSVKRFNDEAAKLSNAMVLCISHDLPFAHGRFCRSEGVETVVNLSAFRSPRFGDDYGVRIVDGPLSGLFSRAVVVLDQGGNVVYTEQVPEIAQEPNYDAALKALGK